MLDVVFLNVVRRLSFRLIIFSFILNVNSSVKAEKLFNDALKEAYSDFNPNEFSGFQENKGQMADQNGRLIPEVLFRTNLGSSDLYITQKGMIYIFNQFTDEEETGLSEIEKKRRAISEKFGHNKSQKHEWCRVDMNLEGANISTHNVVKERVVSQGRVDYFLGHCPKGVFDVKTYEKITFKNIYPGIDWVLYYSGEKGIKHDFIVHPGADPAQIKIAYDGAGEISASEDNSAIHISTSLGKLVEGKLYSYQTSHENEINSSYRLTENHVSFDVGSYNKNEDLIIDPPLKLTWASYVGGTGTDGANDITVDDQGNIFITGYTSSTNFPLANPAGGVYYQPTFGLGVGAIGTDCFITKFNSAGVQLWSTYYGGNGSDRGFGITTDNAGNLFVTGSTNRGSNGLNTFPTLVLGGAYNQVPDVTDDYDDAFILKFDNNGVPQWATAYGDGEMSFGLAITCDNAGNIYVTGFANCSLPTMSSGSGHNVSAYGGGMFPCLFTATPPPWTPIAGDAFVLKFNPSCARVWATFLGGNGDDAGQDIKVDASGNIYVVGFTASTNFPKTNPLGGAYFQGIYAGGSPMFTAYGDAFITKFDASYNRVWSTYYGGSTEDRADALAFDSFGNVYVIGTTVSADLPTQNSVFPGSYNQTYAGSAGNGWDGDMFILQFNSSGVRQWATYYGGAGAEQGTTIVVDKCDNIFIAGTSEAAGMPGLNPAGGPFYYDATYAGGGAYGDFVIASFSNTNVYQWGTYYGGTKGEQIPTLAMNMNSGDLFLGGAAQSTGMAKSYTDAYNDPSQNGLNDAFIAWFSPAPHIFAPVSTNETCFELNNGTASPTATGAYPPYAYSWSNGQTAATATGLAAGTYSVVVRDASCYVQIDTVFFTITEPPLLTATISASSNILCNGQTNGWATVTGAGGTPGLGYTYAWLPGGTSTQSISNLGLGTYTATVSDANGCAATTSVTITQPAILTPTITSNQATLCSGQGNGYINTSTIGGTGPYTYLWNNSLTTQNISNLNSGVYSLTVTDANFCKATITSTVSQPPLLQVSIPTFTNVACNGQLTGGATATSNGGTGSPNYVWSPGGQITPVANGLAAGGYTVTVTDNNLCTAQASVTIIEPPLLTASVSSYTNIACNGYNDGAINISPAGGVTPYVFNWSPSLGTANNVTGLLAGVYSVTLTDKNLCVASQTVTLTEPTLLQVNSVSGQVSCNTGGACDGTSTAIPNGGAGGYQFIWNSNPVQYTDQATGLCPGVYTATITDANNCPAIVSATVSQAGNFYSTPVPTTSVSCFGGNDGIAGVNTQGGTGGPYYVWTTNPPQNTAIAVDLTAGIYTVTVSDDNDCAHEVTITVPEPTDMVIGVDPTPIMCMGGQATITSSVAGGIPGYTYVWSDNQASASITVSPTNNPSVYTLTVSDANGCFKTISSTVTVNPLPVIAFSADTFKGCGPFCVNFENTTPNTQSLLWDFGDGASSSLGSPVEHCYYLAGEHTVSLTVTDNNGCENILSMAGYITVPPNPTAIFSADPQPTTVLAATINFTDQSLNASAWSWSFGDVTNSSSSEQNPQFTYADTGTYQITLIVTSADGCVDTILDEIIIREDHMLCIPNTFSPNGDGRNEIFLPIGVGLDSRMYELLIFDRWGNLIFKSNDPKKGWNGKANGGNMPAQIDTYVWKLDYTDVLKKSHKLMGHVNLIR